MESKLLTKRPFGVASFRPYAATAVLIAALFFANACAPASSPPPTDAADVAIAHIASSDGEAWLEQHGADLAKDLTASEAERVAHAAVDHSSPAVRIYGIGLFFERVDEQKGAEAAATRILKGDDLTGMVWGWMHARPAEVADRRLALIRKEVQERLPNLAGDERTRAEKLLCEPPSSC